ncbi:RNA polymerase sigma factor [Pedobacter duraquae]|uniref:RNA polymerase sigma-70 factor (ECF subfamily) n=1 Tax=Pedobacter duraquae TaxID=425511 RepID=A0A4R6IQC9_9SPHI|nr:RNA polymerase sigma-70 factor [Pedobacter duraquae]TDO24554.1 RNA polymerase sigma-70 factor (ECF subfamily) [Pedobacter duraquae]
MDADCAKLNDESLLLKLRSGDSASFAEIYQRYWPILFRHAFRMLKNDNEAEDVVQDTFTKLWKAAPELPTDTILAAYLYTIVRNQVLNIIARSSVQASYRTDLKKFMVDGYELTDHLTRERILSKLIEDEIQNLPSRMREVFELKRKQHLSYKEIADVMEISELTVKTQMNKAITILRKKLGNHIALFFTIL